MGIKNLEKQYSMVYLIQGEDSGLEGFRDPKAV